MLAVAKNWASKCLRTGGEVALKIANLASVENFMDLLT